MDASPNRGTRGSRQCGTPGCTLADFHDGPCTSQQVQGTRKRKAPPRPRGWQWGEPTEPPPRTECEIVRSVGYRQCGTPGCTLEDFHEGPCTSYQVDGPRKRRAPPRPEEQQQDRPMQRPPRFDPDAAARRVRLLRIYNPALLPSSFWAFVSQSDCGSGLFARAALKPEQAVCEYGGPRLPLSLCSLRRVCAPDPSVVRMYRRQRRELAIPRPLLPRTLCQPFVAPECSARALAFSQRAHGLGRQVVARCDGIDEVRVFVQAFHVVLSFVLTVLPPLTDIYYTVCFYEF